MTNVQELALLCDKYQIPEEGRQMIERIRKSRPSRNVGGGKKNVTGVYPSQKMGFGIQFESHKNELPFIHIREHNPQVLEYYDQPPKFKMKFLYKEKVIGFLHTPDSFVITLNGIGWEEYKPEEDLQKLAEEYPNRYICIDGVWHCPPGEEYAKQFGLNYWVVSSKDINWKLERNYTFIEDYLLDSNFEITEDTLNVITEEVRNKPGVLLIELLSNLNIEADSVYYMIARRQIYFDMENELLAEYDRAHLFNNEQVGITYRIMTSSKKEPVLKTHCVVVAPGSKVLWDGNPWTIINLGENNVSLVNEGNLLDLQRNVFINLVCEDRIKGIEESILKPQNSASDSLIYEASEQDLKIAYLKYEMILPLLEGTGKPCMLKEVTLRTIQNWLKAYRQAEQEYGSGFLGLLPRTKYRGNRSERYSKEVYYKEIEEFIKANEEPKDQEQKVLYGKLQHYLEKKGLVVPSIKFFRKILKMRPLLERLAKTQGSRVAYQKREFYWELDMTTPRHGERPFEVAHIDHTEVDLETVHSTTLKKLGKFWLTLMIDAFTRRILAFYITYDPPSYKSDMMVIRECVRRFNRLPQIIVTDNGRDFTSIYFRALLARYHVTHKTRPPHEARTGSVIERNFRTNNTQLFHNLVGNTKIMRNVRQVTKSVNPKNHAIWNLPFLYALCTEYFYEFYDTEEHSTLCESPRELFNRSMALSGKRPFRIIPYNENFMIMTLPSAKGGTAKVDPQRGIKVRYLYYYCKEFAKASVANTNIPVRYDPWDCGIVYAYIQGKWTKCYSQYYTAFKGRSENEIKVITEQLIKQKKDNASNSKISAKKLAEFILDHVEVREEVLKQRLIDSEMVPQLKVINGGLNNCYTNKNDKPVEEVPVAQMLNWNDITFDLDDEFVD
ncbi:DDE-type integrase/transposase/recombinase [Desulfosporosinus sp. SYSU MS00001]|uniref:DDE-type integrase/transposase/recombinase n=1 Tax=Desulfosporosinus sp. SYSU MS00001 TaxID=3416284 RepID=UPI003CE72BBB